MHLEFRTDLSFFLYNCWQLVQWIHSGLLVGSIHCLCLMELLLILPFWEEDFEVNKLYLLIIILLVMFRCVIRGCVPKKILVYAAQFRGEFEVWSWPHIATDLVSLLLSNSAKSCGLCDVNCNEILSLFPLSNLNIMLVQGHLMLLYFAFLWKWDEPCYNGCSFAIWLIRV